MSRELPREQAIRVIEMVRRLLQERHGGNKAALARELGIKGQAISQWFSEKNSPSYRVAIKVAKLASVTVEDLLGPPLPELQPASSKRPSRPH